MKLFHHKIYVCQFSCFCHKYILRYAGLNTFRTAIFKIKMAARYHVSTNFMWIHIYREMYVCQFWLSCCKYDSEKSQIIISATIFNFKMATGYHVDSDGYPASSLAATLKGETYLGHLQPTTVDATPNESKAARTRYSIIYTVILIMPVCMSVCLSVCLYVGVRELQVAILARSSREMYLTVRIV